ncbi:hypothetical protein [Alicyclobacillus sp.]|uniref:hypothetical protein n=1 Tax=Alicyclobacillus sp. TaxID=61169 RepID=UPI0025C3575B|nr:hypothetical protein [Alicyclobacillus sp.]
MSQPDRNRPEDGPRLAPGLDGVKGLAEDASLEEIRRGDFTRVTRLVWDETERSPDPET